MSPGFSHFAALAPGRHFHLPSLRTFSTLEALGRFFRVTGSSMEVLAEEWVRREDGGPLGLLSTASP